MTEEKDRMYTEGIKKAFVGLIDLIQQPTFNDSIRGQIAEIRQYIMPSDDLALMSVHSIGDFGRNYTAESVESQIINPVPYESLKKSASGFLSYHHTPYEDFFKTKAIPLHPIEDKTLRFENQMYWGHRDARAHYLLQQPHNVMQEVMFIMSRLAFNLGVKTLDYDPLMIVKKTTHPVENLVMFSSDGVHQDILGVSESLNWFQYKMRFPKQEMELSPENKEARDRAYDFTIGHGRSGLFTGNDVKVYRLNIGAKVFKAWMLAALKSQGSEEVLKKWEDKVGSQHGVKDDNIVDITLNEFGDLISLVSRKYRTVIVGHLGYLTKNGIRGKSQGDMALPTAKILQDCEEILMDGYDRAYGPMYIFDNELESKVYDMLSRGDILFSNNPGQAMRPVTVQLDLNTAKLLAEKWEERLKATFFLDVFSLIEKNRMPVNEISMRRADGFKQLGLYVAADTAYNLEPEVLSTMQIEQTYLSVNPPPIEDVTLKVNYISPIIQAIKSTALDEYARLSETLSRLKSVEDSPAGKFVSLEQFALNILQKSDNLDLAVPEDIKQARQQAEQEMEQLQVKKAMAEASSANARNVQESLKGINEIRPEQGGGEPQDQGGTQEESVGGL